VRSERDLRRIEVLSEVRTGRRTVAAAAAVLAVSERQDRSRRVIRTYGWGHPGPFADYRLVIESVSRVMARKLPRP
jgi:hypothetical protein